MFNKNWPYSISIMLPALGYAYSPSNVILIDNFQYTFLRNEAIFEKFEKLKILWLNDTKYSSNPNEIYNNQYYKSIIDIGRPVVPYIIADLKKNYHDWFFALQKITDHNPIKREHVGDVEAMTKDWIEWFEN